MKKKYILALMLTVVGLCALWTMGAYADSYGYLEYYVSDGEITIYDCDESATTVSIPKTIAGRNVVSIEYGAFRMCTNLTSVELPSTLKYIGDYAFERCFNLKKIVIPDSVEYLGSYAFSSCSLNSVTIGKGIEEIYYGTFSNCSMTSVTIPGNVKYIDSYAFSDCDLLSSITLEEGVEHIGSNAFDSCFQITTIRIPKSVKSIGSEAFSYWMYGCPHRSVVIADIASWCNIDFEDETACELAYSTMYYNGKAMVQIVIPEGVETIKDYAFYGYRMKGISIPKSVKHIGYGAFEHYPYDSFQSSLKNITWDAVDISDEESFEAFYGHSNIETVSIGKNTQTATFLGMFDSVKKIEVDSANNTLSSDSFGVLFDKNKTVLYRFPSGSDATDYVIPDGVLKIGDDAFCDCKNLIAVSIPDSVVHIGKNAFENCYGMETLFVGKGVEKIEEYAFGGTSVSSVYIEDLSAWCNIDSDSSPFCGTLYVNEKPVKSLTIPSDVTCIKANAFTSCSSIRNVNIPASVEEIDVQAFRYCYNLERIDVSSQNNNYTSVDGCLYSKDVKSVLICPIVSGNGDYQIPEEVEYIENYAFYNCQNLKTLTISANVAYIGDHALWSANTVYYNGTLAQYNNIASKNSLSSEARLIPFWYVEFVDLSGQILNVTKSEPGAKVDASVLATDGLKMGLYADVCCTLPVDESFRVNDNVRIYVKFEGTKTAISDDGKSFIVNLISIPSDKVVVLALYNGSRLVDVQTALCKEDSVSFGTKENYTDAKVMVWDDFKSLKPVCNVETVK